MNRCNNCNYHSEHKDGFEVCTCGIGSEFHFLCCDVYFESNAECPYHTKGASK